MKVSTVAFAALFSCVALTSVAQAGSIPRCAADTTVVKASWYGKPFHGRTMANGKKYNMHDVTTVAHKSLPFGTTVRLRNPASGSTLEVVVRDRGPYIHGRTFDLSMAGAKRLGVIAKGVGSLEACIVR